MNSDGQCCYQGVVTVSMVEPVLSMMEKPRVKNGSNPRKWHINAK